MTLERPSTATQGKIVAHRGASGAAPENTLAAFREAARQGATWVEFDVSRIGDGTLVVHHDATVDRCTDGTGPLADFDAGSLRQLDAGAWFHERFRGEPVPTFQEALDCLQELGLCANLEMKPHGATDRALATGVADALGRLPWAAERVLVSSFDHEELSTLRAAMPDQPISALYETAQNWVSTADRLRAEALHVHVSGLSTALIDAAAMRSMSVRVYTVNDPDLVAPFRDRGLGGVITDFPDRFLGNPGWAAWANGCA